MDVKNGKNKALAGYSVVLNVLAMLQSHRVPTATVYPAALHPGQLRTWEKLSKKLHPSWC